MDETTVARLLDLNHQFYQTFALQFAQTRRRLQPGVQRLLPSLPLNGRILDVGCGNGELVKALIQRGFRGRYVGLDFSEGLLAQAHLDLGLQSGEAPSLPSPADVPWILQRADLSSPDWPQNLPFAAYDVVLLFAVLHHLPGEALRLRVLRDLRSLLDEKGVLQISVWQFANSPRWLERIQPWETVDLTATQLDPGDYLLDWRHGGSGYRYVHLFSEAELSVLADEADFAIRETFYSDGKGGRLGLYQAWIPC